MVAKGRETLLKSRPATAAAWLRSVAVPQMPQPDVPSGAQHPTMLGICINRDEANCSAMDCQESQPTASNSRRAARQRADRPDRLTSACGDSAVPAASHKAQPPVRTLTGSDIVPARCQPLKGLSGPGTAIHRSGADHAHPEAEVKPSVGISAHMVEPSLLGAAPTEWGTPQPQTVGARAIAKASWYFPVVSRYAHAQPARRWLNGGDHSFAD